MAEAEEGEVRRDFTEVFFTSEGDSITLTRFTGVLSGTLYISIGSDDTIVPVRDLQKFLKAIRDVAKEKKR